MEQLTLSLSGLTAVCGKDVLARFDGGRLSSDGGVLLLRELEARFALAETLAGCLPHRRDAALVRHQIADMIRARLFAIACGYEDCNDLDELRRDAAFKLACGRLPESGADLMSQPTLWRLENLASWRDLGRMGLAMIDLFCDSFSRPPSAITLDIDDTDDAAHGNQQLALFNAYYGEYCFQPVHIFDAATGKPLVSLLRPGKTLSGKEAAAIIGHVVKRLRRRWPGVHILWRGDSHYTAPEVLDLLEEQGCSYVLGLGGNKKLQAMAQPWCKDVETRRARAGKDKLRRFFQSGYRAGSWRKERRVFSEGAGEDDHPANLV